MQALKGYLIGLTVLFGFIGGLNGYYLAFRMPYEPYPTWLAWATIKFIIGFYILVAITFTLWWLWQQCRYALCFVRLFKNDLEDTPANAPE